MKLVTLVKLINEDIIKKRILKNIENTCVLILQCTNLTNIKYNSYTDYKYILWFKSKTYTFSILEYNISLRNYDTSKHIIDPIPDKVKNAFCKELITFITSTEYNDLIEEHYDKYINK